MAAALMSSENEEDRCKGAALLGQAKSPKKAEAARRNGEQPKRKKRKSALTKKIEGMISRVGDEMALRSAKEARRMFDHRIIIDPKRKGRVVTNTIFER